MAQYRCTSLGNCSKADQQEIINDSTLNPTCPECGTTLSPHTEADNHFLGRNMKISSIIIFLIIIGIGIYYIMRDKEHLLTITPSDNGIVKSNDKELNCGSICSHDYPEETAVILTAEAKDGFIFKQWEGNCSGNNKCELILNNDKKIKAIFIASKTDVIKKINPQSVLPQDGLSEEMRKLKVDLYIKEGLKFVGGRNYKNAIIQFKAAITLGKDCTTLPELSIVYSNLGSSYLEENKAGLALAHYKMAQECNPKDAILQYNFSSFYLYKNEVGLVLTTFEKALELGLKEAILLRGTSFCDLIKKDFKSFKLKNELKILLEKYNVYCQI